MNANFSAVSSDDVIAAYQQQLSDAYHRLVIAESRLAATLRYINGQQDGEQQQQIVLPVQREGGN